MVCHWVFNMVQRIGIIVDIDGQNKGKNKEGYGRFDFTICKEQYGNWCRNTTLNHLTPDTRPNN